MNLNVSDSTSKSANEATTENDFSEFGETFEELSAIELFEELARGDENAEVVDYGEAHSGNTDQSGSNGDQSGSSGHQRVLDYWSAKVAESKVSGVQDSKGLFGSAELEDTAPEAADSHKGYTDLELESAAEEFDVLSFLQDDDDSDDWYDDAEDDRHMERQQEIESTQSLEHDQTLDDLAQNDEEGESEGGEESFFGEGDASDVLVDSGGLRYATMGDEAGDQQNSGDDQQVAASEMLTEVGANDWLDQAEASRLEDQERELEEARSLDNFENFIENDEIDDEDLIEEGVDGEAESEDSSLSEIEDLETEDVTSGEGGSFGGGSAGGGDAGQGRSRGQYVLEAVEEADEASVSARGNNAQIDIDYEKQAENKRQEQLMQAALEEAQAQQDGIIEQFLNQRETMALQDQRQDQLAAITQFQGRLEALTQFAGQQGFMGLMGIGGIFGAIAPSPTTDRRGLILEKPKEKQPAKGAGVKAQGQKTIEVPIKKTSDAQDPGVPIPQADKPLTHQDLVEARREAFEERFGRWLAARDEELGDEDDQQFIAQMLQEYDQYTFVDSDGEGYRRCLWLAALELMTPASLSVLCERVLSRSLPNLRGALARCARKERILSQDRLGDLRFVQSVDESIQTVSQHLVLENPYHRQASSAQDAFALLAKRLALPLVVVDCNGTSYTLRTPNGLPSSDLWCVLQVWDIDWSRQRLLILMEGDRFTLLRRGF